MKVKKKRREEKRRKRRKKRVAFEEKNESQSDSHAMSVGLFLYDMFAEEI